MAQLISTAETPEEAELRRRQTTARRIKILAVVSVGLIATRLMVSDPKRKAPIDYTRQANIKIVPGMLDTMPLSARANLDPRLVAKMVMVDEQARRGEYGVPAAPPPETGPYRVADAPSLKDLESENYKEQVFAYARRRRIDEVRQAKLEEDAKVDNHRTTLVQFASGGYVLAEEAQQRARETSIRVDHSIEANFPSRWVASIRKDAKDWQEPVPAGQVRLKPARGITVILHSDTARRVTVESSKINEI